MYGFCRLAAGAIRKWGVVFVVVVVIVVVALSVLCMHVCMYIANHTGEEIDCGGHIVNVPGMYQVGRRVGLGGCLRSLLVFDISSYVFECVSSLQS